MKLRALMAALLVTGCASTAAPIASLEPGSSTATAAASSAAPASGSPEPATSEVSDTSEASAASEPSESATKAENLAVPAHAGDVQWREPVSPGGCDRPEWPEASATVRATAPGMGRRVLVLGDSLTREISLEAEPGTPTSPAIRAALAEQGWTPTVVCWKGVTTEWTLQRVNELDQLDLLPPRVVIATGTNDLWVDDATPQEFGRRAAAVLGALAATKVHPQVWWVNLWLDQKMAAWNHAREPRDPDMAGYEAYNEQIAQVCTPAVNCTVVDWHAAVESDATLPARIVEPDLDGVHMNALGAQERAAVIVAALAISGR